MVMAPCSCGSIINGHLIEIRIRVTVRLAFVSQSMSVVVTVVGQLVTIVRVRVSLAHVVTLRSS